MTTVTSPATGFWINKDGLIVRFGTQEGATDRGGQYSEDDGVHRITEVKYDFGDFTANVTIPGSGQGVVLPAGAFIERVDVMAEIAVTSGGASTIDVGLAKEVDYQTLVSQTGLVSALPKASLAAAGQITTLTEGVTNAGSLIGTVLAFTSVPTIDVNTGPLTAGKVAVRIYWYMPTPQSNPAHEG